MIVYPEAKKTQLFDLSKDPWETKDVSGHPEYRAAESHLRDRLHKFQRELGDDLDPA